MMAASASGRVGDRVSRALATIHRYGDIRVVAAVKHQPIDTIREALLAGIREIGVNQVQQCTALREAFSDRDIAWHFIGHIQSRKGKLLLDYDCVQSIDRLVVARAMNEHLLAAGKTLNVLIEVNIGDEVQKSGVRVGELDSFLTEMSQCQSLRVFGLMAMPPFLEPPSARAGYFRKMRGLFERQPSFSVLSMGTSTDFEVALSEGSTMVRLGTTLFGERPKATG